MRLSDSDEDTNPYLKEVGECSKPAIDPDFKKPHVVACIGEEGGEGCSTRELQQTVVELSVTSEEPDTQSNFHPTDSEYDPDTTCESTSSEDNSTEEDDDDTDEEDGSARGEVICNPKSHAHRRDCSNIYISTSKNVEDIQ